MRTGFRIVYGYKRCNIVLFSFCQSRISDEPYSSPRSKKKVTEQDTSSGRQLYVPHPVIPSSTSYVTMGFSVTDRRQLGKTGILVSPLGFGASPLGNIFGNIDVSDSKSFLLLAGLPGILQAYYSYTFIDVDDIHIVGVRAGKRCSNGCP